MARLLRLVCILVSIVAFTARASTDSCSEALLSAVDGEIAQRLGEASWRKRAELEKALERLRPNIEAEVIATCPDHDTCSVEKLRTAVAVAVDKTLANEKTPSTSWKIYGLFAGTVAANAALTTLMYQQLPQVTASFLSSCLTVISAALITSIGAPVMEPLVGRLRKMIYGWDSEANRKRQPASGHHARFEKIYRSSQEELTTLAQMGRTIENNATLRIQLIFSACAQNALIDRDTGLKLAPGMIGKLVVDLVRSYPELDLAAIHIAAWARNIFSDHFLDEARANTVIEESMVVARHNNPNADGAKLRKYRRILESWLRPSPPKVASST